MERVQERQSKPHMLKLKREAVMRMKFQIPKISNLEIGNLVFSSKPHRPVFEIIFHIGLLQEKFQSPGFSCN